MLLVRPRVRHCLLLAVACLCLGSAVPVHAQANMEQVNDAVASMRSGDRDKIAAARNVLINNLNAVRTAPPALATFSHDIGAALMPIATGNDPHAKLNAAIVVQRTADLSGSADLAPITARFIADESAAVSAYGLRSASSILPRMWATQKGDAVNPLVPAIVDAVGKHPESEAVAAEAYNAMVRILNDRTAGEVLTPAGVDAATKRAIDALHALLTARVAQYGSGSLAEPAAEMPASSFLGKQQTYNASTAPQRLTTIRLLLELMDGAANEMGKVPPTAATSRLRLQDLRNLIKNAAQSLSVITSPELFNKPELRTAAQKAGPLSQATPTAAYRSAVNDILTAFRTAIPEVRPTTQGAAPATGPAGGATTAPSAGGAAAQ